VKPSRNSSRHALNRSYPRTLPVMTLSFRWGSPTKPLSNNLQRNGTKEAVLDYPSGAAASLFAEDESG
jgi:hypothetical protein